MHICKYCHKTYQARPQVKSPKACPKCQKKRQRENEKDWRNKNKGPHDAIYHKTKRLKRIEKLKVLAVELIQAIIAGFTLKDVKINLVIFKKKFTLFFIALGIRRAKKLCPTWKPLFS